jgi:hypothetical protein
LRSVRATIFAVEEQLRILHAHLLAEYEEILGSVIELQHEIRVSGQKYAQAGYILGYIPRDSTE